MPADRVAVQLTRGGVVESVHRASIAVCDARGRLVASFGDPRLVAFVRSSFKPFQAVPLVETGAADRFGFTPEELAIICASHNGEDVHVRLVEGILRRIGLGPEALRCGAHAPYHRPTARRLGDQFTVLHNNCSGKHAGMLAACVHNGWDASSYLDPSHPLQQRILDVVAAETGVERGTIPIGTDGCSAPNFALPLRAAARAFARLIAADPTGRPREQALARLRDAMLSHPHLVAGDDRVDTKLMRAFPEDLWVKAGGESCYGMAVKSLGLGVAVKIEDGSSRGVAPVLASILDQLGADGTDWQCSLVRELVREAQTNWAGKAVGELAATFRLKFLRVPKARPENRASRLAH